MGKKVRGSWLQTLIFRNVALDTPQKKDGGGGGGGGSICV